MKCECEGLWAAVVNGYAYAETCQVQGNYSLLDTHHRYRIIFRMPMNSKTFIYHSYSRQFFENDKDEHLIMMALTQ